MSGNVKNVKCLKNLRMMKIRSPLNEGFPDFQRSLSHALLGVTSFKIFRGKIQYILKIFELPRKGCSEDAWLVSYPRCFISSHNTRYDLDSIMTRSFSRRSACNNALICFQKIGKWFHPTNGYWSWINLNPWPNFFSHGFKWIQFPMRHENREV